MPGELAPTFLRLGPRSAGLLMTPEEFDAARFVGRYRYELIRGVLVVSPPPGNAEVDPNEYLGYLLLIYRENHPQGSVIDAALPEQTLFMTADRRRCDRAIWTGLGRTPDPERDLPTIAVEFVSGSSRDRRRDYEQKRGEYLAAGIAEYWVIDRFRRTMTVYANAPDGIVERVVREDESYETPRLPGFVLPITRLLARADLWPPRKRSREDRPRA
jgi:Uma2 family endonuclease